MKSENEESKMRTGGLRFGLSLAQVQLPRPRLVGVLVGVLLGVLVGLPAMLA